MKNELNTASNQLVNMAVRSLTQAGVKFKVIGHDGAEYGDLEVVKASNRKKREQRYPRGMLKNYYEQFLVPDLEVGGMFAVPSGDFPPEHIRGAVCSQLGGMWGKDSYKSTIDKDGVVIFERTKGTPAPQRLMREPRELFETYITPRR
jgi:hypothetical protein